MRTLADGAVAARWSERSTRHIPFRGSFPSSTPTHDLRDRGQIAGAFWLKRNAHFPLGSFAPRQLLGQPLACPLCSESYPIAAQQRNDVVGQQATLTKRRYVFRAGPYDFNKSSYHRREIALLPINETNRPPPANSLTGRIFNFEAKSDCSTNLRVVQLTRSELATVRSFRLGDRHSSAMRGGGRPASRKASCNLCCDGWTRAETAHLWSCKIGQGHALSFRQPVLD